MARLAEIDDILDSYHAATLFEMANAAGIETARQGKKLLRTALVAEMRETFFARERVLASLERLNPRERAVLDRLLLRDGTASTRSLKRETVRAGLVSEAPTPKSPHDRTGTDVPYASPGDYCGRPHRSDSTFFEDVIARLTFFGLVFSRDVPIHSGGLPHKLQFHPGKTLFVPQVIRQVLPQPAPIPPQDNLQPRRVVAANGDVWLRNLYLYWDFVRRSPLQLLQTGAVSKRGLKALNQTLLTPDSTAANARNEQETTLLHLLRQIAAHLGLLRVTGGQLCATVVDTTQIPEFWNWPRQRQIAACLEAWSQLGNSGELNNEASRYMPQYTQARRVLLETLKSQQPLRWLDWQDFWEEINHREPCFLFPSHEHLSLHNSQYYHYGYYDNYGRSQLETLERFESSFITTCLTGFVFQTGVVDLGYLQDGPQPQVFRLTPFGAAILNQDTPPATESGAGRLIVQPNFQLLALGPVELGLLVQLDLFADRERADQAVFEYHLTRESVYRAQQLGLDAASVLRFLHETSHTEVPQNVRRSIEEWGAHHERIVFRNGANLLQTADAALLKELMQDGQLGPYFANAITPELALLAPQGARKIVAALLERGILPTLSDACPQSDDKSVRIESDGTVHTAHAVPSIHLRERISRLAEENGRGEWRLTPASIAQAGGDKEHVQGILNELQSLHRGPALPEELVAQIKAWGGYYGAARIGSLTLVEFDDVAILDELLKHPDLQSCLTRFPAGERSLAVIADEHLAHVERVLASLGVGVTQGLP